jgi:rhodanese-related sulfurtransferase
MIFLLQIRFKMKNKTIFQFIIIAGLILVLLFILIHKNETSLIDSNEFENLIQNENVFVINTHTPYTGEITGTDLIAEDWENMVNYIDELPEDKSAPIAVYCRSGRMAGISAEQLIDMGYTNVYNLEGGMNAWKNTGRSLTFDNYDGSVKEFDIIASSWEFNPDLIEVDLGDRVILHVESIDTFHGIGLIDFGINAQLSPGEIVDIEFIADKKGSFSFFCSVSCGGGHSGMTGVLVVN